MRAIKSVKCSAGEFSWYQNTYAAYYMPIFGTVTERFVKATSGGLNQRPLVNHYTSRRRRWPSKLHALYRKSPILNCCSYFDQLYLSQQYSLDLCFLRLFHFWIQFPIELPRRRGLNKSLGDGPENWHFICRLYFLVLPKLTGRAFDTRHFFIETVLI